MSSKLAAIGSKLAPFCNDVISVSSEKHREKKTGTFCWLWLTCQIQLQLECLSGPCIGLQTMPYRRHFMFFGVPSAHAKIDSRTAKYTYFDLMYKAYRYDLCQEPNCILVKAQTLPFEMPLALLCHVHIAGVFCIRDSYSEEILSLHT